MRLAMPCLRCVNRMPEESRVDLNDAPRLVGDIEEAGIARARCEAGHETTYVLNEPAFELIFEFAALGLVDGYYREAILGFAAATERLFGFVVELVAARRKVKPETFTEASKPLDSTERQLGAFLFSYAIELKKGFDLKPIKKFADLRKNVAQGGYIATADEAVGMGTSTLALIHQVLKELFGDGYLHQAYRGGIGTALNLIAAKHRALLREGEQVTSLGRTTIVGFCAPATWGARPFTAHLEQLRIRRHEFYATGEQGL